MLGKATDSASLVAWVEATFALRSIDSPAPVALFFSVDDNSWRVFDVIKSDGCRRQSTVSSDVGLTFPDRDMAILAWQCMFTAWRSERASDPVICWRRRTVIEAGKDGKWSVDARAALVPSDRILKERPEERVDDWC